MEKILVIEDNENDANLIRKILSYRGYQVARARTGVGGIYMA